MDPKPRRPKGRDGVHSKLNLAIKGLDLAEKIVSVEPAKVVFAAVRDLLVMIKDSMANEMDCVDLGLACADVCEALKRGMNGRQAHELSRSVFEAIETLKKAVAEIVNDISKLGQQNVFSSIFHSKGNKDKIAAWRAELDRILQVFNTELAINTHVVVVNTQNIVSDIHRTIVERQGGSGRNASRRTGFSISTADEFSPSLESRTTRGLPPPPPRTCFGREELIKKIVDLADTPTSIALIGAGGTGKTSVSLAVLHHDHIKRRFGDNRRFIRCDQFPASCAHFLAQLSKTIGAGVENPQDLVILQPFLSSNEMLIVLDNAESILDPQGANGREIYGVVEELSRFPNVCLVITSRITTIPPNCETLKIPTLSTQAARDAFYDIYKYSERSDSVNDILRQLDFHPLSVTLLATVAHQNQWDNNRLAREWRQYRTGMLQTEHQTSLATAIEMSLSSPLFRALGPNARELLGVVAFYPQGLNENNLGRLFPTIPNVTRIFDKFRILSLTYQSSGFITMLAPLRDHLRPKGPELSSLLHMTKDYYFTRMSVNLGPTRPGFNDARWIAVEDMNVEHLLDVLTSIDPHSNVTWVACNNFMKHLHWFKPRQTLLMPKIEALPDNHHYKSECLSKLATLFDSLGNFAEQARLLNHALKLERGRRNDGRVAFILRMLSRASLMLSLAKEGIHQAEEALKIYERLGNTYERARCLDQLAQLLRDEGRLDAAEEAAVLSSKFYRDEGQELGVCRSHQTLGHIFRSKGQREKAVHHYEAAIQIASSFRWNDNLFAAHLSLAELFLAEDEFDGAYHHANQAKSQALNKPYYLGRVANLQAWILYRQHRPEDARSEALHALEIFEKAGALKDQERCRALLQDIEQATQTRAASVGQIPVGTVHRRNRNREPGRTSVLEHHFFHLLFPERVSHPNA